MPSKRHSNRIEKKSINPGGPLVIIDSHSLAHAAKNVVRQNVLGCMGPRPIDVEATIEKAKARGAGTVLVYVFLRKILNIVEQFGPRVVAFAWDDKPSNLYRKLIDPAYKSNRGGVLEDVDEAIARLAYPQFDQLRDIVLPAIGFKNIFLVDGYEADDIIAYLCHKNSGKVIVVSTDGDLYQLLTDDCSMYNPIHKIFLTRAWFMNKWDIEPREWGAVKAITGCDGDVVRGVFKVGNKYAIRFLKDDLPKGKIYERIMGSHDLIVRNLQLVVLPFGGIDERMSPIEDNESFVKRDFIRICNAFKMPSLVDDIFRWSKAFRMV